MSSCLVLSAVVRSVDRSIEIENPENRYKKIPKRIVCMYVCMNAVVAAAAAVIIVIVLLLGGSSRRRCG